MHFRSLEARDIPVLKRIHQESGFDYDFPDLFSDQFVKVMVLVDENDVAVLWAAAKKSVEMYFFLNREWRNPRWRLNAFAEAHEAMLSWLAANGWDEINAFVPPQVEKSFGRRLVNLFNWNPGRWKHFSRKTAQSGDK